MSLQFVIGGSGSGKTTFLYHKLIEMSMQEIDQNYIAIVPEQFTLQTQKDIVSLHPNHGVMNIDIVSFERLAYRVFEELAMESMLVLDDMGKSMVLRKVAAEQKQKLGLFRQHLNQTGFINQLKSMLSELYQYGISSDQLKQILPEVQDNPLLLQKLNDLSVLYENFKEYMKNRYITTEEILDVLCNVLPNSKRIKNSIITLDGYTGFTPVQYRLIELFLRYAKRVFVTVTLGDQVNPYHTMGHHQLFYMSKEIIDKLTNLADGNQVYREDDIRLKTRPYYRFEQSPALDFLEQNLLRYHKKSFPEETKDIVICAAQNPAKEVELVVREIQYLLQEEGIRYRDIAVITGDLATYEKQISYQFEVNEIPYFLDQKKNIISNPMVELVRAALQVVQKDFSYESIFRYLKTGLVTEENEMIYRLENYVIALGIRGFKRWDSTWEFTYRGREKINLEQLNAFREKVLKPIRVFRGVMREKESTVQDMTRAVVVLLEELNIKEKLRAYQELLEHKGEYGLAKEYDQAYDLVMGLFERLVGLLGREQISNKEYADILDAGFLEIKVGLIPATVDRVVVGDITRTRMNQVKILFFMGVNDGVVPISRERGGVLLDSEREFLKTHQMSLAPTAKEDGFRQRFYLYLLMTKPKKRLYLSYAAASADGKGMRPSSLIGTMKKLYPHVKIQNGEVRPILSVLAGKQALIQGIRAYGAGREETHFKELFRLYYQSEKYHDEVAQLVEAAFYTYTDKGIGRAAAKALYGTVLSGSVTRLEQYAACAYSHFLRYGLELMERREYEIEAVDMGNLFHDSIDAYFKRMKEEGRDWQTLTEDTRKELVKSCVEQVTSEYCNKILKSSARNAYMVKRVERITDRTIWALGEQIKKGDFVPTDFEVSFSAIDNLQAMKISLSQEERLELRGRIDRMDLCEDENHVYVKIIDYKSGGTTFDLAALYYGLQLQLVVYMDAALELEQRRHKDKKVLPAGIFYYNINDPLIDKKEGMDEEGIEKEILKKLRMNGLVNSDLDVIRHLDHTIKTESDVIPVVVKEDEVTESRSSVAGNKRFELLRGYAKDKLKKIGQEILAGETGSNPYKQGTRTACDYCPYHSVCGFDGKTKGYRFRRFKTLKSEEVWNELEGEE